MITVDASIFTRLHKDLHQRDDTIKHLKQDIQKLEGDNKQLTTLLKEQQFVSSSNSLRYPLSYHVYILCCFTGNRKLAFQKHLPLDQHRSKSLSRSTNSALACRKHSMRRSEKGKILRRYISSAVFSSLLCSLSFFIFSFESFICFFIFLSLSFCLLYCSITLLLCAGERAAAGDACRGAAEAAQC